jgi:hypothetical protein
MGNDSKREAQGTHHAPVTTLRPVVAQKLPAVQLTGADMDALAHSWPRAHGVKAATAAGQYEPAGHATCVALDAPAGQ